jgi:serine/threonine protein kinase
MTRSFETGSSERYGIAASIEHANVVGIHYAGEHQGVLLVVMDFVYATELQHLLEELGLGALQADRAVDLLMQFASALDAGTQGLVHRGIKPANMLVTVRDGHEHEYLTDFGVAKRSDNTRSKVRACRSRVRAASSPVQSSSRTDASPAGHDPAGPGGRVRHRNGLRARCQMSEAAASSTAATASSATDADGRTFLSSRLVCGRNF